MTLKNQTIEIIRPPHWLLVDDNQEILALMEDTVGQLRDVRVSAYTSSYDALVAFQAAPHEFQYIVTDLEMPGMNGFELCEKMRALAPSARIFLATGSQQVTLDESRRKGFCGLLMKPFTMAVLEREIAALEMRVG